MMAATSRIRGSMDTALRGPNIPTSARTAVGPAGQTGSESGAVELRGVGDQVAVLTESSPAGAMRDEPANPPRPTPVPRGLGRLGSGELPWNNRPRPGEERPGTTFAPPARRASLRHAVAQQTPRKDARVPIPAAANQRSNFRARSLFSSVNPRLRSARLFGLTSPLSVTWKEGSMNGRWTSSGIALNLQLIEAMTFMASSGSWNHPVQPPEPADELLSLP
jgi:hypothetical protein